MITTVQQYDCTMVIMVVLFYTSQFIHMIHHNKLCTDRYHHTNAAFSMLILIQAWWSSLYVVKTESNKLRAFMITELRTIGYTDAYQAHTI